MSLFSLLLVVLAAVIHASWNLLAKRASDAGPVFMMAYTCIATLVYLPWAAWIFIESELVFGVFNTQIIVCVVLSGLLHLAYSLFLQRGYQVADLSVVYPIARGAAPVVSTMGAFLFLGEPLLTGRVIGLIAVVIGVFLVATRGNLIQFRQPSAYKGVSWGGATGAMIAGYSVVDAYGVKILGIHPVLLDWFANLVRLVMLFPWLLSNRKAAVARMSGRWGACASYRCFVSAFIHSCSFCARHGGPSECGGSGPRDVHDGRCVAGNDCFTRRNRSLAFRWLPRPCWWRHRIRSLVKVIADDVTKIIFRPSKGWNLS